MIVLITGCSKGFGLMFAEALVKAGHTVYATARDLDQAPKLRELAEKLAPRELRLRQLDVRNPEHMDALVSELEQEGAGLDVLINNAGYGLSGKICELSMEALQEQLLVNVVAPTELTRRCLPMLRRSYQPLIINLSSIASYLGLPGFGAYAASKTALNNLSMSLAAEESEHGVRVAVLEPGPFATEFRQSLRKSGELPKHNSKLFATQEDPAPVIDTVVDLLDKRQRDKLPIYLELPIGTGTNLLRLATRWLPQTVLAKFLVARSKSK